jgi:hypothetical protein
MKIRIPQIRSLLSLLSKLGPLIGITRNSRNIPLQLDLFETAETDGAASKSLRGGNGFSR